MNLLFVIIGGALGALVRYYTERWSVRSFGERIPYGTAIVNLAGALILGTCVELAANGTVGSGTLALVGTGFCGSLTTFSGWVGQIENRLRHKATRSLAWKYMAWVTFGGIALAGLGIALAG